jgi:hypothetical protein
MRTRFTTLALAALCSLAACDDHDHDGRPAACKAIQEACHVPDPGSGPIHECHENAEETWSQAECASNETRCLNLCKAAADASAGN